MAKAKSYVHRKRNKSAHHKAKHQCKARRIGSHHKG
jgi:hypothetical protein